VWNQAVTCEFVSSIDEEFEKVRQGYPNGAQAQFKEIRWSS